MSPLIYIISNGPTGARYGRFPLQHDEQGPFVVLPGGKSGVEVRLIPEQIKPGSAFGADYYCDLLHVQNQNSCANTQHSAFPSQYPSYAATRRHWAISTG